MLAITNKGGADCNLLVDVKVRNEVHNEHLGEAPLDAPVGKQADGNGDTDVRHDDLPLVLRSEEDR